MKNVFLLIVFFLQLITITLIAQEKKDTIPITAKLGGFVNAQAIYDTRQNLVARESMVLFYPLNESLDKNGKDINAKNAFNQFAMTSRVRGEFTGPKGFGANTYAMIEADFTGPSNIENNALRLRHAYIKLTWAHAEILMGQYWHPLNVPEMLPEVVSLNTGAPFHPFSRQPQIRASYSVGKLNIIAVISNQRDYVSNGPLGASYEYMKNAAIPNGHLQIQYKTGEHIFGVAGDAKVLQPKLKTDSNYVTNETLKSFSGTAFAKIKTKPITFKIQGVWGQNLYDQMMTGGYAVATIEPSTASQTYTNLDVATVWADISTNNKKFQAGVFAGYLKNLGSLNNMRGKVYARGIDVAYIYRVAPRLVFNSGKLRLSTEFEYTVAAYGKPNTLGDFDGKLKEFGNFRTLISLHYFF